MRIPLPGIEHERGLGDAAKAVFDSIGVHQKPGDCRCPQRHIRYNGLLSVGPRKSEWTEPPEVPAGWVERDRCGSYVMFERGGSWIIWEIADGRYHGSRSFCAGAGAEAAAREAFEGLCPSR